MRRNGVSGIEESGRGAEYMAIKYLVKPGRDADCYYSCIPFGLRNLCRLQECEMKKTFLLFASPVQPVQVTEDCDM